MNKNGDYYVLAPDNYECADERLYGSSMNYPQQFGIIMNFVITETVGSAVYNSDALARAMEFRHAKE